MNRGGDSFREGDWTCGECQAHNFASRDKCFKCNARGGNGGGENSRPPKRENPGDSFRDGDWNCEGCQAHNFASRDKCFKCGQSGGSGGGRPPRGGPPSRGGYQGGPPRDHYYDQGPPRGDYGRPPYYGEGGPRGYEQPPPRYDSYYQGGPPMYRGPPMREERDRYDDRRSDRGRGGSRGDQDYQVRPKKKPGDFYCSVCGELNFAQRMECRKCGKRKDQDLKQGYDPKDDYKPGDWQCPKCDAHNFASRKNCFKCQEENVNFEGGEEELKPGEWRCFGCQNHVSGAMDECDKCGRSKNKKRDGDIDCPQCGKLNFSFRNECIQCGTYLNNPQGYRERGRSRSRERGNPKSDFKSGDWACSNCSFHNFASRMVCKDCGNKREEKD